MAIKFAATSGEPGVASRSFYKPELDGLRFFACFAVFFHHFGFTRAFIMQKPGLLALEQAGAFGVCLFFLLSAYLITELLWKERDASGSIHLGAFYARRILRIWPLYFACLLLYGLLALASPHYHITAGRVLAIVCLAANWYCGRWGWANLTIDPLWSISVEEQFYILVPTIARFGGKPAIWTLSILFLVTSQGALLFLGRYHVKADPGVWTNSLVQFQFFAAGCILALVLKDRTFNANIPVRLALFVAGGVSWIIAAGHLHLLGSPTQPAIGGLCLGYPLVLAGATLFFLAVYGMPSRYVPRSVAYLGKISFGLYLFHGFVMDMVFHTQIGRPVMRMKHYFPLADVLIEAGVTVLIASLSYRFFEKPILRFKDRFAIVHSRPA